MKKINLLALSFLLINSVVFSQTLFVPGGTASGIGTSTVTGNIGIGVSNPSANFEIRNIGGGDKNILFVRQDKNSGGNADVFFLRDELFEARLRKIENK